MKVSAKGRNFLAIFVMALMLAAAAPVTSFANDDHGKHRGQGNGEGRSNRGWENRDDRDWTKHNRKCGKFVNCHDARNGRWDNRGPRGDRVGNRVRNIDLRNRFRNRLRNRTFYGGPLVQRRMLRRNR